MSPTLPIKKMVDTLPDIELNRQAGSMQHAAVDGVRFPGPIVPIKPRID